MSLPTAAGYTFGTVFASAAAIDPQLGVRLGDTFELADGTQLQLVQVSGSVPANAAMTTTVVTTGSPFVLAASAAVAEDITAVNDRSGATGLIQRGTDFAGQDLTDGQCAFVTIRGLCMPLLAASLTAGPTASLATTSNATVGVLTHATLGTNNLTDIIQLVTTTGAAAALCRLH